MALEYFTVHAQLIAVVVDYVDADDLPDIQDVTASVKFIPRVPAGSLIWASGLSKGIALPPIQARFDTDGYLRTIQAAAHDEKQTVTVTGAPTSYKLAFNGSAASAAISGTATAATVESTLEALSTIGAGNVTVGGNNGGPYTVAFVNALGATAQPLLVASAITGGSSPAVNIVETQAGSLNDGVKLVANNADIDLDELIYDVSFTNVVFNKADQVLGPFAFVAPTVGGSVINLASVEKVPPKPGLL